MFPFKNNVKIAVNSNGLDAVPTAVWVTPFALWAALSLAEPSIDQYKSYTFATVKQRTTRVIGKKLIEKLFSLDHRFHSNRETGEHSIYSKAPY